MENQAHIQRAQELQRMGKSIRQIAAELYVSKSKVFRWLNGQQPLTQKMFLIFPYKRKNTVILTWVDGNY